MNIFILILDIFYWFYNVLVREAGMESHGVKALCFGDARCLQLLGGGPLCTEEEGGPDIRR